MTEAEMMIEVRMIDFLRDSTGVILARERWLQEHPGSAGWSGNKYQHRQAVARRALSCLWRGEPFDTEACELLLNFDDRRASP